MATLNSTNSEVQKIQEALSNSMYIKREWITTETLTVTEYIEKYSEECPKIKALKFLDLEELGVIIRKDTDKNKNGYFCKMLVHFKGGSTTELELSYQHKFGSGECIDLSTLKFCKEETFDGSIHFYATGESV